MALWVIVAVVVIAAAGTSVFWQGVQTLLRLASFVLFALVLATGAWLVWRGGPVGWCASDGPARTLSQSEFIDLAMKFPEGTPRENIFAAADLKSRERPGCWRRP
jgi:ABC-type nickel/cobalt efflux system permease component RcnA